jgi:Phage tail assembly chaperone proteins, E, or 41 or 14
MADGNYSHQLIHPIERLFKMAGGGERSEVVSEIILRKPLAGDLRVMDAEKGDTGKVLALLVRISGLDMAVIDRLDLEDFSALAEMVSVFMQRGPATG